MEREDLSSGVISLRNSLGTDCEFPLMTVLQNVETPCRNSNALAQSLQALSRWKKMCLRKQEESIKMYAA